MIRAREILFGLTIVVLIYQLPRHAHAQRIPFARGDTVRVSQLDSSVWSEWQLGSVLDGSRSHVWLQMDSDDPIFRFNESIRLQVRRGRHSRTVLGGIVGSVIGAVSGATFLSSTLDYMDVGGLAIPAYAAVGAAAGALIGLQFGPPKWVDVPFEMGRVPAAPLTVSDGRPGPFKTRHRWTRFAPTYADFHAFFTEHADSVHAVEGIWELYGTPFRVAIVRESRFRGYGYGAYALPVREDTPAASYDGYMTLALTEPATDGSFQVRFGHVSTIRALRTATHQWAHGRATNDYRSARSGQDVDFQSRFNPLTFGAQNHDARFAAEGVWQMTLPDGAVLRWEKRFP